MATAAALSVRISANTSEFDKSLKGLERSFNTWGGKLTSIGSRMTAAFTLPLAGAAVAATKFAADFERTTTRLVTLSGISEEQMRGLRQAVLDLAPAVGIGPQALAEAMLVVTSTGFEGAAALDVLRLSAMSSAVGMGDTKDVARALTAAVTAYGIENLSAAQAADILHQTVVAGGAEANELAGELGRVVGVASMLGVGFEEVGAFIATYTRLGLSAAEATTGLSGALNTILNPSQEARKALGDIGVSAEGLRRAVAEQGLGPALSQLLERLNGNADAIGAVFGNVRALAGIMGTAGTQAQAYEENLAAITNSTGSLNTAFERTKQTTAFLWERFKAEAQRAAITIGAELLPAMTSILRAAVSLSPVIVSTVQAFAALPDPIKAAVIGILGFGAALGPLFFAIGKIAQGFAAVAATARLAGPALTGVVAAASSTAGAVAGVAALAAGFAVLAVKVREAIREMGLWNATKQGMSGALAALSPSLAGALGGGSGGGARRTGKGDIHLPTPKSPDEQLQDALGISKAEWDRLFGTGGAGGGGAGGAAKNPLLERLAGTDALSAAKSWMAVVREIGGITKLTADEQAEMNRVLSEAIDKYVALGQRVPVEMAKVWHATMPTPEVRAGLAGLGDIGTLVGVGSPLSMPTPGVTSGLGGLGPIGTSVGIGSPLKNPRFLARAFGDAKQFGADLSNVVMSALTGGGDVAKSIGGFFSGGVFSKIGESLSKKVGGMLGGVLGSVIPGLGTLLGSLGGGAIGKLFGKLFGGSKGRNLVEDFAQSMGGFDALQKQLQALGDEGEQLWKKLTQGVGRNNPEQAKAAIEEVTAALENQKQAFTQAISDITEGVNARAANVSGQGDLDVVGAGAVAAFALQIKEGTSAIDAFQSLAPAITAMRDAMAAGNLTLSESAMHLLNLGAIIDQNALQFQNLGASGQILQAMLKGNIMDGQLFAAVATDIGTQIQTVIDRGVPMAQVFALAQPQLQALWEAQQKWGFAVDETTANLLKEAEAQGFVGAAMTSVNQQILSVLVAIGDVLGAKIPDALRNLPAVAQQAADGMNAAFARVKGPDVRIHGDDHTVSDLDVPEAAQGAYVKARQGGTLVRVGEGGQDEVIMPLGRSPLKGGSGGGTAIIEIDGEVITRVVVPRFPDEVRRYVAGN